MLGEIVDARLEAACQSVIAQTSLPAECDRCRALSTRERTMDTDRFDGLTHPILTAALVCEDIQDAGQIPFWGTSTDNIASKKVAAKAGFDEVLWLDHVCRS